MYLTHFKMIDLTHTLSSEVPTWDGSCGFYLESKNEDDQLFRVQKMKMDAGIGTHMDAPAHLFPERASIADIPCEQLIVPACIINVTERAHADYEISLKDVVDYELHYGPIQPQSIVIAYTGWSRYWNDPHAYRNADASGHMHFPAFSAPTVAFLLTRNIAGIGIDTLSPDCLDHSFPVHRLVLEAGKYIIENVADCSQMPAKGGYIMSLPLKCQGSTESPIRMIGLVPK